MILLTCMLCTVAEAHKIHAAQTLINQVLPTHCFANKLAERGVGDGWINEIQGANKKLPLYFYYENNSTVGYMNPGSDNIYLNRKFHDKYSLCKSGSNIVHELTHVLGFRHFVDVAYAANYAFDACCAE